MISRRPDLASRWYMVSGDLAGSARVVTDQVTVHRVIGLEVLAEKDLERDLGELRQPLEGSGSDTSKFPALKLEVIRAPVLVMDLDLEKQQEALVVTADQVKALVLVMYPARVQAQGRAMPLEKAPVRDLLEYPVLAKDLARVLARVLERVLEKVPERVRVKVLGTDLERDLVKPLVKDRQTDPGKTRKWVFRTYCVYCCLVPFLLLYSIFYFCSPGHVYT
mmetsp:Transcript_1809/g.2790  ORF Transcript_1809/g.2790 Transcript_1809/m.2790 type:complete len:221 (+) Transcript_1809:1519-2181(+)